MSEDKVSGKITNVELQIMVDELKRMLPYQIEQIQINSKILKARYDSLKKEGFSDKEALEIVKARGIVN